MVILGYSLGGLVVREVCHHDLRPWTLTEGFLGL